MNDHSLTCVSTRLVCRTHCQDYSGRRLCDAHVNLSHHQRNKTGVRCRSNCTLAAFALMASRLCFCSMHRQIILLRYSFSVQPPLEQRSVVICFCRFVNTDPNFRFFAPFARTAIFKTIRTTLSALACDTAFSV
jgi:hypothetical protein